MEQTKKKIKIKHDHPIYLYCNACGTGGAKGNPSFIKTAINIHESLLNSFPKDGNN